jgi:O-antigen/teichoic acid export membrane protein
MLRLLQGTFVYSVGDVVAKICALVTLPIYTRYFTPAEFGAYAYVGIGVQFFTGLIALGADQAYALLFFGAGDEKERRILTSTWLSFLSVWSVFALCVALLGVAHLSAASLGTADGRLLWGLGLACAPLAIVNGLCGQALRNRFRMQPYLVLSVAAAILPVLFGLIAVVAFHLGAAGAMGGIALGAAVILPFRLWSIRDELTFAFSWESLKKLLVLGIPAGIAAIASGLLTMTDRLMLGQFVSLHDFGIYSIAFAVSSAMLLVSSGLWQAWTPFVLQTHESDADAPARIGRAATYALAGLGLAAVTVSAFAAEIVTLLAAPQYRSSAGIVPVMAFGLAVFGWSQIAATSFLIRRRNVPIAIVTWTAVGIAFIANLVLIPRFGLMGAAWATVLTHCCFTAALLGISRRHSAWIVQRRQLAVVILLIAFFVFLASWLPALPLAATLAMKAAYVALFAAALVLTGGVDVTGVVPHLVSAARSVSRRPAS